MNWISIKDRLPPEGQHVLVFFSRGDNSAIGITYQYNNEWTGKSVFGEKGYSIDCSYTDGRFDAMGMNCKYITHWMPLPEPPKDEK